MVAEQRVETIPVTTCSYRERGAGRALRGPDLPLRRRGAASRPYQVTTCSYAAEERVEHVPVRTCRMVAETASRQVPVCMAEQVPVTVNRVVARQVARTVAVQQCTMVPVVTPTCLTVRVIDFTFVVPR